MYGQIYPNGGYFPNGGAGGGGGYGGGGYGGIGGIYPGGTNMLGINCYFNLPLNHATMPWGIMIPVAFTGAKCFLLDFN